MTDMNKYDYAYYEGADLKSYSKPIKPRLGRRPNSVEALAYAEALAEYERELESYKEHMEYYNQQRDGRMNQLHEAIQVDYDINPKQFAWLWSAAYENGHSEGLQQVVNRFDEYYNMASAFAALEG
jgi:hypothetical protein